MLREICFKEKKNKKRCRYDLCRYERMHDTHLLTWAHLLATLQKGKKKKQAIERVHVKLFLTEWGT